jgi:excisionase family DNA binding protein
MIEPDLLSVDDLAGRWQVHPDTVRNHIRDGRLETVRVGRLLRVRREAAEAYLAASAERPTTITAAVDGAFWSISIDGAEIGGNGSETRAETESALWNVPPSGGEITVDGQHLTVPHRAAGRAASIALAGLAMVPGGDTVTVAVQAGDDPLDV